MTDPAKCPSFVRDYDCRADYIDQNYHVLQQKVRHCTLISVTHNLLRRPAGGRGMTAGRQQPLACALQRES